MGGDGGVLDRLDHVTIIQRKQVTRGACGIFLILSEENGESSFPLKQKDGLNCLPYTVRIQYIQFERAELSLSKPCDGSNMGLGLSRRLQVARSTNRVPQLLPS